MTSRIVFSGGRIWDGLADAERIVAVYRSGRHVGPSTRLRSG